MMETKAANVLFTFFVSGMRNWDQLVKSLTILSL